MSVENNSHHQDGTSASPLSDALIDQWRMLMTVVARTLNVAVGLVTRIVSPDILELAAPSFGAEHFYPVGSLHEFLPGLYCERIRATGKELIVRDAISDAEWSSNPDLQFGLTAYFGVPCYKPNGEIFGTICVLHDSPRDFSEADRALLSSARDAVEESLRQSMPLVHPAPPAGGQRPTISTWDFDVAANRLRLSKSLEQLYRHHGESRSPKTLAEWYALQSPVERKRLSELIDKLLSGERHIGSIAIVKLYPSPALLRISIHTVLDEQGRVSMLVGTIVTVSAESLLGKLDMLDSAGEQDGVISLRVAYDGRIVSMSSGFKHLLNVLDIRSYERVDELFSRFSDYTEALAAIQSVLNSHSAFATAIMAPLTFAPFEYPHFIVVTNKNDNCFAREIRVTVIPEHIENELPSYFISADRDAVTGLPNRRVLLENLSAPDVVENRVLGVVEIINIGALVRGLGYSGTDQVLVRLAHVLNAPNILLASIGFGHFAFITQTDSGQQLADSMYEQTQILAAEMGIELDIAVRIVDAVAVDAQGAADALSNATEAARLISHLRPGGVYVAQHNNSRMEPHWLELARNFDQFAAAGKVCLACQPIVSTHHENTHLRGEIMLRLRNADGSLSTAAGLIEVAEIDNMISRVDRWVFESVLRYLSINSNPWVASINVSGRTVRTPGNWQKYLELLDQYQAVDPSRIIFELTESCASRDIQSTKGFVSAVRARGGRISLDDFGIGFNSLSIVQALQIDEIKIDKSFVQSAPGGGVTSSIVQSLVKIAKAVGAVTVAEGVEDETIAKLMTEFGADYLQGYHFGEPILFGGSQAAQLGNGFLHTGA